MKHKTLLKVICVSTLRSNILIYRKILFWKIIIAAKASIHGMKVQTTIDSKYKMLIIHYIISNSATCFGNLFQVKVA